MTISLSFLAWPNKWLAMPSVLTDQEPGTLTANAPPAPSSPTARREQNPHTVVFTVKQNTGLSLLPVREARSFSPGNLSVIGKVMERIDVLRYSQPVVDFVVRDVQRHFNGNLPHLFDQSGQLDVYDSCFCHLN